MLGVVHKSEFAYDPKGQRETEISLDSRFEWFGSGECKALLKGMEAPAQGANPFSPAEAAGIAVTLQSEKEIAPCASAPIPAKIIERPQLGDEKAHRHLAALLDVLERDGADGLWPQGHADCLWGEEYPHEYSMAQQYVESGSQDSIRAFLCNRPARVQNRV